jgi:hypothetical protein
MYVNEGPISSLAIVCEKNLLSTHEVHSVKQCDINNSRNENLNLLVRI